MIVWGNDFTKRLLGYLILNLRFAISSHVTRSVLFIIITSANAICLQKMNISQHYLIFPECFQLCGKILNLIFDKA